MKDDYLWDKTGDDPEIQRLEDVLSAFRYQEGAAPALPAVKSAALVEKLPSWRFSFAYTLVGCTAAAILLMVWLQFSGDGSRGEEVLAVIDPAQSEAAAADVWAVERIPATAENTPQTVKQGPAKIRRAAASVNRTITVRRVEKSGQTAILTSQEKYAYGQLMLALSITSSKLKIVQDTINGIENKESAATKNER